MAEISRLETLQVDLAAKTASAQSTDIGCARCTALETELARVRQQQEEAVRALAEERERTNALRLNYPTSKHDVGSHVAPEALEVPVRYVVVDAMNEFLKGHLGYLHAGLKRAVSFVRRIASQPERKREP